MANIIINELLCYMLNKIDSVPQDTLVRLISENFDEHEVEAAKGLLCEHVADSVKAGNRRGQNKKQLNIQDIYKMTLECNRDELPRFVALSLAKLPPVSIDCIDVSSLLRKQQVMEIEVSQLKSMIDDVLKMSVETSQRVETVLASDGKVSRPRPREALSVASERAASAPGEPPASVSPAGEAQAGDAQRPARLQGEPGRPRLEEDGDGAAAATASSYAAVAAAPVSTPGEEDWSVANKAKRGKPPPKKAAKASPTNKSVVGLHKTSTIKAVKSVKRLSIFVSRLPPGTDAETLQEYAREQVGATEAVATKLETRFDSYESYRLDIANPSVSDVLDPELWAQGLLVRRFFAKRAGPNTQ